MALWLVRAGKYGEHEARFLEQNLVCLTFSDLVNENLTGISDYEGIKGVVQRLNPESSIRQIGNSAGQIWAFAQALKVGDWIVLPRNNAEGLFDKWLAHQFQLRKSLLEDRLEGRKVTHGRV